MKQEINRGELLLRGPGRDKLLAYAKSFEDLSRSFYFLPDKLQEDKLQEDKLQDNRIQDNKLQAVQKKRREILWHNRLMESRVVVADQLQEVSRIITEMADEIGMVEDVGSKKEEKIRKFLKREGLCADEILIVENKEKRIEIYMNIKSEWGSRIAAREAAEIISEAAGIQMIPAIHTKSLIDKEYHRYVFEEAPSYQLLTGYAKLTKEGEEESGDSFSFAHQNCAQFTMSLSDGMGSGHTAAYESKIAIELLEQFLDAGFDVESTILMINGAMIGRNEEQTVTSLDIVRINLHTALMNYYKTGASATFIKRGTGIELIQSESLPLGIFHNPDFDKGRKKLYDEDMVVMVTDGVLDRIGTESPEKLFGNALWHTKSNNPKEIAKRMMEFAIGAVDTPCRDDMTILVAGIWKNQ